MKPSAILLLHCPDKPGIISEVTKFITDNKGNIIYLDQYVDREDGIFFMRIEWELELFLIPREKIKEYIETLYSTRYQMTFNLYFTDERPRMAIFVSKMSHCLYDLLARYKAGEWNVDIPCIVSNHEDLRYIANQFDIPYYVWSIKKDHSNKAEVEQAEMELLKEKRITFIVLARYMQIISDDMIKEYPIMKQGSTWILGDKIEIFVKDRNHMRVINPKVSSNKALTTNTSKSGSTR